MMWSLLTVMVSVEGGHGSEMFPAERPSAVCTLVVSSM
jgi:hypothetical protein